MQFTPQQLAGAGRYGSKTRIGNWLEDNRLEETKFQDYRRKKERGGLAMSARDQKEKMCLQPVPHSYSEDGFVHFGDDIMLNHPMTGGTLANDLWDEVIIGSDEFNVTVSDLNRPVARNTFKIMKLQSERLQSMTGGDYGSDGVVKYGEPFHLVCNDSLLVDDEAGMLRNPYYLKSVLKTDIRSSKISNHQAVSMSSTPDASTVWVCARAMQEKGDGVQRLLADGRPVPANADVVIMHRMTGAPLHCSPAHVDLTEFGPEKEVCCLTVTSTGKAHKLMNEFSGTATADVPSRAELGENRWQLCTSDDPAAGVDERQLPPPPSLEGLLQMVIRTAVGGGGAHGVRNLKRAFNRMDEFGDGQLDREDFKWGMKDAGVRLSPQQMEQLLDAFDRNGDGFISLKEFMNTLRGPLSERRQRMVHRAFRRLDSSGNGAVSLSELCEMYDSSWQAGVSGGVRAAEDAVREFMEQFETKRRDGTVTLEEFEEYYADVGATMDDDDAFDAMMRAAWHLGDEEEEGKEGY